ncbi:hypothetical protein B296_00010446 [Ensete ventricosum]|uniref:Uncharacterized protein n=1 Tax=Ensete ventricosum TaxID=4639 RepID=A0A426ZNB7_ENSVE|nr:hypothetical protein B296_00010446 [Ensete ventricosum]
MVTAVGVDGIGSSVARLEKRLKRRSCVMGPPSSAKCWGHAATWDDESARELVVCEPHHRYSTRHVASRPLSGVLQAGRLIAFASTMPPAACCQGCYRSVAPSRMLCHVASYAAPLSGALRIGRDSGSSS